MNYDLRQPKLFVTSKPLPGYEKEIKAHMLVALNVDTHNNVPALRPALHKENNTWIFAEHGMPVHDPKFLTTLSPRPDEGYYILTKDLHVTKEILLPSASLVQLSYSIKGVPILYIGNFVGTSIEFADAGYKFHPDVVGFLKAAGFRAPDRQPDRQLH